MNGEGKRQLPSWMLRSTSADQASISEMKGENKENNSEELVAKACEPQKKVQRKQHKTAVPLLENKSHLIKECEARRKKRKSIKQDEDQGDDISGSDLEKKVDVKVGKRFERGNEPQVLKKRESSKRESMPNDHDDDILCASDHEKKADVVVRKRYRGNAPRKKQNRKELIEASCDGTMESMPSEYELTVEDLISIAKEYVNADKDKELQESRNVGFESETKSVHLENRKSVTDKPPPSNSLLAELSPGEGTIINTINTGDPARDMLDLLLGPLLKKSEQMERKYDV